MYILKRNDAVSKVVGHHCNEWVKIVENGTIFYVYKWTQDSM